MSDYAGAIWSPNNNFFPNTGKKSFVILHGTAGGSSAEEIAAYFKGTEGGSNPVSSHYIVGQDGHVVQTVDEKDGSYANGVVNNDNWTGNPNYYTISVEHVKSDDANATPLTPTQQAASFALIKDICQRNGIGMHDADDTTGITGHFSIDPVNRSRCPGVYPWDELWTYLTGNETQQEETPIMIDTTNPIVAGYFKASSDGKTWTCKNGFIIGGAILDWYKKFGNSGLCGLTHAGLPISNEVGLQNGRVMQRYERLTVFFDPSHTLDQPAGLDSKEQVYIAHIDSGPGQDPRVEDLQDQVAALKSLPATANLQQINTFAGQIVKLSQVQ